ncbi:ArsR family transcriptional regulator [Lactococcus formosensis]|uniref:ArsC/Spx/MgsR family protein n=1 Tax=Lactococcus formosensis TaxID=1281486 RepID=UPI002434C1CD|nr:ArsC/Spx/MgsR family protein [Lactococcus formosensis]MDG6156874.1 ArsR family transcriptional regulator [Lactococcus formosensis]
MDVEKLQISKITRNDLVKILQLSDEGLKDIVKRPGKSSSEVRDALKYMELLSFNEALDFLISHPYVLQTPIIMGKHNYLIGYNEDEIRKFLSKEYRRHRL